MGNPVARDVTSHGGHLHSWGEKYPLVELDPSLLTTPAGRIGERKVPRNGPDRHITHSSL